MTCVSRFAAENQSDISCASHDGNTAPYVARMVTGRRPALLTAEATRWMHSSTPCAHGQKEQAGKHELGPRSAPIPTPTQPRPDRIGSYMVI